MIEPIAVYFEHCRPGWQVPAAKTANHIFILVTSGSVSYQIDGNPYQVFRGSVLFVPQGVIRQAHSGAPDGHDMYAVHFRHSPGEENLPILTGSRVHMCKPFHFEYLRQRCSFLTQNWLRKSAFRETLCHCRLLEVLAHVSEEAESGHTPAKVYSLVMQLQEYIVKHYREPISIADLAKYVNRSPNYVSSIFKKATGETIGSYVQGIKVAAARDLLTNSSMSIGEISDYLGYCEPSYFNRVFKRITGVSPSAFVKEGVKVWSVRDRNGASAGVGLRLE